MTDLERRKRIYELCEQNEDYRAWKEQYDLAYQKFTRFTEKLPKNCGIFFGAFRG